MNLRRIAWYGGSLAAVCVILGCWKLVADARLISPVFLPSPDRAFASLSRGLESGDLKEKFLATLHRMLIGWLVASIFGVAVGAVIGSSRLARNYLSATLEALRPLPASAMIPVAIALLGLNETMVISVIAFGALWPLMLATIHGFENVEPRLYEVARVLHLSKSATAWKIALPSALPDIMSGARLSLTASLALAVAGEMLIGVDGLGQAIIVAGRMLRSADVFAGVFLLMIMGIVTSLILNGLDRWLLRWRDVQH